MNLFEFEIVVKRRNCIKEIWYLCVFDKYLLNLIEFCLDILKLFFGEGNVMFSIFVMMIMMMILERILILKIFVKLKYIIYVNICKIIILIWKIILVLIIKFYVYV